MHGRPLVLRDQRGRPSRIVESFTIRGKLTTQRRIARLAAPIVSLIAHRSRAAVGRQRPWFAHGPSSMAKPRPDGVQLVPEA